MAYPSKMQSDPLRFTMPRSLQQFDLFEKFPYDIRHIIWEELIFTPGIHFLKFVKTIDTPPATPVQTSADANSSGSLVAIPERHAEGVPNAEGLVYSAALMPVFPLVSADNSYYITKKNTLTQLRKSCDEAKFLVEKVLAQPGNLTLDDGQLVLLQRSTDVVCIDYPNISHGRYLGKWAEHLNLDQLAKVRRLAVRYHHEWDNDQVVCAYCGRVHSYHGKHPFPRHVYEFAALFKNLESFYFIDYLTVRKPSRSPRRPHQAPVSRGTGERFASGGSGRTYFEVDPESCTTHTRVHETLSWLRNNYLAHCRRKSLGPSQPENVRFKVLACEWDSDQKLVPPKRVGIQTTLTRKRRARIHTLSPTTPSPSSPTNGNGSTPLPANTSPLPVVFGDAGKSKFDFSLEIPH